MRIKLLTLGCLTILLPCVVAAAGRDSRLVDAVKSGDVKAVRAALQQGASVSAAEPDGSTALHEVQPTTGGGGRVYPPPPAGSKAV